MATSGLTQLVLYHCSVDEDDMDVRVGSTKISTGTPIPIEDVIISPNYNHDRPERGGNLALVIPDDDLPMGLDVFAINYVRNLYTLPEDGSMITVFGWGQTEVRYYNITWTFKKNF